MTDSVSNITSNLVRKRLEQGVYEYPDPDWVQKYNNRNFRPVPGWYNAAPSAAWQWAVLSVAEFYNVDLKSDDAMTKHIDEMRELYRAYVLAKAPGTEEPKRYVEEQ